MSPALAADGAVPIAHWGVIRARGADAARFLHAQLTNDIEHLGAAEARWAGFCSAKGRLQATFLVWRPADDEVLLACSADLLAPTLKRLSMFVLRLKCVLSDASAEVPLVGVAGETARPLVDALPVLGRRGAVICLPDAEGVPRALLAGAPAPAGAAALSIDAWRRLEVRSAIPWVVAATVDRFVPQMVNLELTGGVDFGKGCYPGQEVVARSQYRGTVKRRMARFDADVALAPGDEVYAAGDPAQPAGLVVDAAPAADGTGSLALVEVKLAALGGTLHAQRADGPVLRPQPLPYTLPVAEDITA